jgi:hypothetical protein
VGQARDGWFEDEELGRYNDFFVIPNEQYDRANEAERHALAGLGLAGTSRKRQPEYVS